MNVLAAVGLGVAFAAAAALVVPSAQRTGLGIWHPAVACLVLEAVFFGVGGMVLAVEGTPGPALFTAGAIVAFGLAVGLSDRFARGRADPPNAPGRVAGWSAADPAAPAERTAPVRPVVAAALVGVGLLAIAGTVLSVGIPLFAGDITGARSELTGIPVQLFRVALPAAAICLAVWAFRSPADRRARAGAAILVGAALLFEIALASRYLAAELVAALAIASGIAGFHVSRRAVLAVAVIGVLAFGGIQVLRAYDQAAGREVAFALERTGNRLFLIQPRTLDALQVTIPAEQPYFGGLTWLRRVGPFFGRDDVPNLGYWIFPRVFPGQDPPGYLAPGLIGEAWANYGPAGILLFVLLGVVAERFGALVARRRTGAADVAAGALGTLFLARTHALGLNGLIVLAVLVAGWRLLVARPGGLMGDLGATVRWRT